MNVNEIIMNKRIERGVSRKELAEGLGVSGVLFIELKQILI